MGFRPFWRSTRTDRSDCGQLTDVSDRAPAEAATTDFRARLDGLVADVARLGKEQFRATTLLEGHGAHLQELSDVLQEHVDWQQRELAGLHRAQTSLAVEARLQLLTELLPVADGLQATIRAGREMLATLRRAQGGRTAPVAQRDARPLRRLFSIHKQPVRVTDDGPAVEAWLDGLVLLERRLLAVFERHGVTSVPTIGQPFNPYRHLAVAARIEDAVADGTIVAEELTGYAADERVLRHAEVVVARNSTLPDPVMHTEAS